MRRAASASAADSVAGRTEYRLRVTPTCAAGWASRIMLVAKSVTEQEVVRGVRGFRAERFPGAWMPAA